MIHNLFKNEVYLEPNEHKYFDSKGNQYISFSALYGKLVNKFDADKISKQIAKYGSSSADDLKAKWAKTAEQGTRFDNALERYSNTATILDSDEDLKDAVPEILKKYKVYNKVYHQVVVYDEDTRSAGSTDSTSIITNRKDSAFDKGDWKCFADKKNEDGSIKTKGYDTLFEVVKDQPWLNAPFEHLPNTKFTKISFQLSYYARHFEKLTGRKCRRLFIDLIVPTWDSNGRLVSFENHVVNVNYLRNDIEVLLATFKDEILDQLDGTEDIKYEPIDTEKLLIKNVDDEWF